MAIKRVTFELDDSPNHANGTTIPEGVRTSPTQDFKGRELTVSPSDIRQSETDSPGTASAPLRAPGRTISDLIAEFKDDARAMATILMFVPFVVFVAKIHAFGDLLYPFVIGVLLNVIWFGVSFLARKKNSQ